MNGTTEERWEDTHQLIYLASPYTSIADTELILYETVLTIVGELMDDPPSDNTIVYSPILHNHALALKTNKGVSFVTWEDHNLTILSRCDELWVLQLTGWDNSIGVRAEIRFAHSRGLPIKFIDPMSHFPIIPIENAGIVSAITNTKVTT